MDNKHRKTLAAIFKDPISGTLEWSTVEALFLALGCQVIEGSGSPVRFVRQSIVASFHRPHPAKEAKRYQVRDAREYLKTLGVMP